MIFPLANKPNKSCHLLPLLAQIDFILDKVAVIKRADLFEIARSNGPLRPTHVECRRLLLNYILHIIGNHSNEKLLSKIIESFTKSLLQRWNKARRYEPKFKKHNDQWLDSVIITSSPDNRSVAVTNASSKIGRPKILFEEGSETTKRRRVQEDVSSKTEDELCLATEIKLRVNGKRDVAAMLHKMRLSPKKATRLKTLETDTKDLQQVSFSPEEALAFFVSFKFTRYQYIGLRDLIVKKGLKKLFPRYDKIIEAKKMCYPSNVVATNLSVEVPLQNILDHTASRVFEMQKEVVLSTFTNNIKETATNLIMIYKWGSDGSGSQSNYKQKCEGDDSNILTTSIVPLRLQVDHELNKKILWQNPRTSSTRFCRPVRIQFTKETNDVIKAEFSDIENQIDQLSTTKINANNNEYIIHHKLLRTMVDGKVCNSLMSSSSQKCYICNAGPQQFNNLNYIKTLPINPVALNLGLSTLHAYIRFFECLIHISYRLNIKVWRVPKNQKDQFENRKKEIIRQFRAETGLLIDIPKPGFGNTNDGNTARRFFADPALSSTITGIDQNLIYRCSIILKALNSNYPINSSLFGQYAFETAELYVNLYAWYPMPPTVHKILMHSKEVIEQFLIPIGQLGEDAQESRHKETKYYREHNTRKISRKHTNEDLFNILLVSSDPLISSLRVLPPRQDILYSRDVIKLLLPPEPL